MVSDQFLFQQNEFLIIAFVLALLLAATEIGFRRGRAAAPRHDSTTKSQHTTLQGATMGLLALLLAFTFSMSSSRFETRKQLVVEESNAIGTAWLRAHMLPQPQQGQALTLLRNYVDARLACYARLPDPAQLDAATSRVRELQKQLWSQAVNAAAGDPHSNPLDLYIRALNSVFEIAATRDAARDNHVPQIVLFLLFLMAILSVGLLGFGCGLSNTRQLLTTTTVCLLLGLVTLIILDLDRPRRGLITIRQKSMFALRDTMR